MDDAFTQRLAAWVRDVRELVQGIWQKGAAHVGLVCASYSVLGGIYPRAKPPPDQQNPEVG